MKVIMMMMMMMIKRLYSAFSARFKGAATTVKHKIKKLAYCKLKARVKRSVLSLHSKMSTIQLDLISCGRGFHRSGAATEKARLP